MCPHRPFWQPFMENARLIIYMSPLHRDAVWAVYPAAEKLPYALVPSAIDPAELRSSNIIPIAGTVLGVNCLLDFKGRENIIALAESRQDLSFTFIGGTDADAAKLPSNCTVMSNMDRSQLLKFYTQFEYLAHLPVSPQPSERIPIEFALINMKGKLIVNRNVGVLSYPGVHDGKNLNRSLLRELVTKSPQRFWEAVERFAE